MSTANNSYPNLPEIPYQRTTVEMPEVVLFAKTLIGKYPVQFLRMAYAVFRNESANGSRGVNNNYAGIQADVGQWKDLPGNPIATCVKVDSGGANRRFLCFGSNGYEISFELIVIKSQERNMVTAHDYFAKWVSNVNQPQVNINSFQSLLDSAAKVFPS